MADQRAESGGGSLSGARHHQRTFASGHAECLQPPARASTWSARERAAKTSWSSIPLHPARTSWRCPCPRRSRTAGHSPARRRAWRKPAPGARGRSRRAPTKRTSRSMGPDDPLAHLAFELFLGASEAPTSSRSMSRPAAASSEAGRPARPLEQWRGLSQRPTTVDEVVLCRGARGVLAVEHIETAVSGQQRREGNALQNLRVGYVDTGRTAEQTSSKLPERLAQSAEVRKAGPRHDIEVTRGAAMSVRLHGDPSDDHEVDAIVRHVMRIPTPARSRQARALARRTPLASSLASLSKARPLSRRSLAGRSRWRPVRGVLAARQLPRRQDRLLTIESIIARRRGHVTSSAPASIPAIALGAGAQGETTLAETLAATGLVNEAAGVMTPYTVSASTSSNRTSAASTARAPSCAAARAGARSGCRG